MSNNEENDMEQEEKNDKEKFSKSGKEKINTIESSDIDIIAKVNEEAKKINPEINAETINVFQKYHNLSLKELKLLLLQKNEDLIRLNDEKEKSKSILTDLVSKLNSLIKKNYEYLYNEDDDDELILNLTKTRDNKTKELESSKKSNNFFKSQLNNIKSKVENNEKQQTKINLIDSKIEQIKKKNVQLKKEINEIKSKKLIKDKESELIIDKRKFPIKLKIKTEEMNNFASQKHEHFSKLNKCLKNIDIIPKEIKKLEEIYSQHSKEDVDGGVLKKINFWKNLIMEDLNGKKTELLQKIEQDNSKFLNEIKIRNEEKENLNNDSKQIEDYLSENNRSNKIIKVINTDNSSQKLGGKNILSNRYRSSSLLLSNGKSIELNKNSVHLSIMRNQLGGIEDNEYKTLFKKLNYLKARSPSNLMEYNNYSKKINNNKYENLAVSEEKKTSLDINKLNLNEILENDYLNISDADYRELLSKKEQYLDSNLRLEKNIIEIKKTKNAKLAKIFKIIQDNEENLEIIKKQNKLMKKEILNLENVLKLTLEQAKLKNEIKQNKIQEQIKVEENKILFNSETDIRNDIVIPKKLKIKPLDYKKSKSKKEAFNKASREEKLKIIKEKYKDGNLEINSFLQNKNDNKRECLNNKEQEKQKEDINIDDKYKKEIIIQK